MNWQKPGGLWHEHFIRVAASDHNSSLAFPAGAPLRHEPLCSPSGGIEPRSMAGG
jgi:hypothetical protein